MRIGVSWEQGRRERTGLLALGGLQGTTTEAEQPLVPRALAALDLVPAGTDLVPIATLDLHWAASSRQNASIVRLGSTCKVRAFL
jgi:hypothetical protein